jgi:hypothetical protein
MTRLLLISVVLATLGACSNNKVEDLKSPCVGAEGSPCDRRPVNMDIIHPKAES